MTNTHSLKESSKMASTFKMAAAWRRLLLFVTLVLATAYGQEQSILDVVASSPNHRTLLEMLKISSFDTLLKGPGMFTLLAPTDMAFRMLDRGILNKALTDNETMMWILSFHVILEVVFQDNITNGMEVPTVAGTNLTMTLDDDDGKVTVNEVAVITNADLVASNGVVHAVDNVLLPWNVKQSFGSIVFRDEPRMVDNKEDMMGNSGDMESSGDMEGSGDTKGSGDMESSGDMKGYVDMEGSGANESSGDMGSSGDVEGFEEMEGSGNMEGSGDMGSSGDDGFEDMEGSDEDLDKEDLEGSGNTESSGNMEDSEENLDKDGDKADENKDKLETIIEGSGESSMDLIELANQENLNTFLFLAENTQTLETLREEGPFTLLVPHDEAGFSTLDSTIMDQAMTDPDAMVKLLSYHIIPGVALKAADIPTDVLINYITLEGTILTFRKDADGKININGDNATVVYKDLEASNGVIHVIDKVLVPDSLIKEPGTLVEVAQERNLKTLVRLIEKANLTEFSSQGEFTLFAPTDEAFASLPEGELDRIMNEPHTLQQLVLHHTSPHRLLVQQIGNDAMLPSLQGNSLRLNIFPKIHTMGIITVNGARIIRKDVPASNGVIYIIDRVLMPPEGSIGHLITKQEDLKTFNKILQITDMDSILRQRGPYTVLAPVDEAFERVPSEALEMLMADIELLKTVVLNHILPFTVYKSGIKNGILPSMGNGPVSFELWNQDEGEYGVMVASMKTTTSLGQTDIPATNGVLHKINDILFT